LFTFYERATPVARERDPTRHAGGHADTASFVVAATPRCDLLLKMFLGVPVLGVFWALRLSRKDRENEEESYSQKIAKITKTIPWMESQRLEPPRH
jgi:hypothetical protein